MKALKQVFTLILLTFLNFGFYSSIQPNEWKEITMKEYDEIIRKASTFFEGNKKSYTVDVSISSFKTHSDKSPVETQKGFVLKSGSYYHHFMLGVHTYQNKHFRFVVDSMEKNIMVANPENENTMKIMESTYDQFRSHITSVQKITQKETDLVKVTFKDKIRVSYIEMEFDKKGLLKKSTSYFRVKVAEDATDPKSKKTTPRIETIFSDYKDNVALDYEKEFSEAGFFVYKNGQFAPSKKYAGYYIKDTRLKGK